MEKILREEVYNLIAWIAFCIGFLLIIGAVACGVITNGFETHVENLWKIPIYIFIVGVIAGYKFHTYGSNR